VTTAVTSFDRFATAAHAAGMPLDQVRNFARRGYIPHARQCVLHGRARAADRPGAPDEIAYGGARGGGKSHAVFAQAALDDCQREPGLRVLYVRKIQRGARQQLDQLRRDVLAHCDHSLNRNEGVLTLPTEAGVDSVIVVGGFRDERDIDNYLGLQYDAIVLEEATALTRIKYQALLDSLRSSLPGWRPRVYNTTNPGGVGHQWYASTFAPSNDEARQDTAVFIPATVDDNPHVDAGYVRRLERNTGWRLAAYRYGDWSVLAGAFFTTWRERTHVVGDVEIAPGWPVWGALDYGFNHWNVFYLLTRSRDGLIYVVDEVARRKQLVETNADDIVYMLARHGLQPHQLRVIPAGSDVFARHGLSETTIADRYAARGLRLSPAVTDRISGAARVMSLLGDERQPPRVRISRRCRRLIECLPALQHDPRRPDDVLKIDADDDGNGGDDPYDAFRYGVMSEPRTGTADTASSPLANYRG
jgi:phage terminase large subunit